MRVLPWAHSAASAATTLLVLPFFALKAYANCECGYSVNATSDPQHAVYTDLLESDFLHLQTIQENKDWIPQTYLTPAPSPSQWGKNASDNNIRGNPTPGRYCFKEPGRKGGDAGLQLYVRSGVQAGGSVPIAELVTTRRDMLYGSFRSALKYTPINGTCGAFFFYQQDTAEIDMELLSSQISPNPNQLNLVIHYGPGKSNFKVYILPFNPSDAYHEYRFDWSPGSVDFYADGKYIYSLTTGTPKTPGGLRLMHWSTGDPFWSRGPPQQDAIMTVSYVKAYFNSSNPARNDIAYNSRCHHPQAKTTVCQIPDLQQGKLPDPNGDGGETFFFTEQKKMAIGQNWYHLPWYSKDEDKAAAAAEKQPKSRVRRGDGARVKVEKRDVC